MKIALWGLYIFAALFCTFISMLNGASPWFTLVLALAFIFGPKVWRRT